MVYYYLIEKDYNKSLDYIKKSYIELDNYKNNITNEEYISYKSIILYKIGIK